MVATFSLMVKTFRDYGFTIIGFWSYQYLDIMKDLPLTIL